MAGTAKVLALLKALALASWRDIQSFRSIAGQNFFLFLLLVALQPQSAEFFVVILVLIILFPLSADPMQKIPIERRVSWPVSRWEWSFVRVASLALNPLVPLGLLLLLRAGWRTSALVAGAGALLQLFTYFAKRFARASSNSWLHWIPAPPGAIGAIMRLQVREMLRTLDPYFAFALLACAEFYRASGKSFEPAAAQIISLLIVLAMSTEAQVLFGIDGNGAERYRLLPIRGWQILLAKDLGFLTLLAVLVLPLDFVSGFASGLAVLAVGHHRSVLKAVPQARWRFTSGALFPDGIIQIVALFAVGLEIKTIGVLLACLCLFVWLASLFFYGWQWDRRRARLE